MVNMSHNGYYGGSRFARGGFLLFAARQNAFYSLALEAYVFKAKFLDYDGGSIKINPFINSCHNSILKKLPNELRYRDLQFVSEGADGDAIFDLNCSRHMSSPPPITTGELVNVYFFASFKLRAIFLDSVSMSSTLNSFFSFKRKIFSGSAEVSSLLISDTCTSASTLGLS